MTSLKWGVTARGVCPQKTIYLVREEGVGPVQGPIQRHFDLHSRPPDAQIVLRYQDTLKAAYRLYSEYDANLGRLSVLSERLWAGAKLCGRATTRSTATWAGSGTPT